MSKKILCTAVFAVATAVSTMAVPAPSLADPKDDLAATVKVLQAQVKALEALQAGAPVPGVPPPAPTPAPVVGGDFPGSFKLPGGKTSMAIHGWISLQSFYDPQQNVGDKFQIGGAAPAGSVFQKSTQGTWHMHGKLTRLIVESRTPTKFGPLRTYWASDFYGFENGNSTGQQAIQNNNYSLRVVHAYGTLGGFLAGKTWSNFIDDPDSMQSLDNAGPAGVPSEQTLQVRYTHPLGDFGNFSVSAENPITDLAYNTFTNGVPTGEVTEATAGSRNYGRTPDLTAKYEIEKKWGHAQVSGVFRDLTYSDPANGNRYVAGSGGAIFGFTLNLPRDTSVGAQTWFGNGIQKFTPDDFGSVSSAQIDLTALGTSRQVIYPSNEHGVTYYAQHVFSPSMRANIGYGFNYMQWQGFLFPDPIDQPLSTHTLHANVIWSPVPQTDFGLEFINGRKVFRDALNLPPVNADRFEGAFRYRF